MSHVEQLDCLCAQGVTQDRRQYIPPVTWSGDGFVMVEEEGVIIFYVRDLPKSMDYNLVLRYQSNVRCYKNIAIVGSCKFVS